MKKFNVTHQLKAFGLIETIVAISLFALVTSIFTANYVSLNQGSIQNSNRFDADTILSESVEAIRSIRDQNFLYLTNGNHGLQKTEEVWNFNGTQDLIYGIFTRKVTIGDVYRDDYDNVDPLGNNLDVRSKQVTINLTWESDLEGEAETSTQYIITDSYAFDGIITTGEEWGNGTHDNTASTSIGDGTLILAQDNTIWQMIVTEIEFDDNADANAIAVIGDRAYVTGDYHNSATHNFATLDVGNHQNVSILGDTRLYEHGYDIVTVGSYAYVATDDSNGELKTVSIASDSTPSVITSYNISGISKAFSIATNGTNVYIGTEEKSAYQGFYIFSIANPGNPSLIGSKDIDGDVRDIAMNGNTAYLAADSSSHSFQILDVSNPNNITTLAGASATPQNEAWGIAYQNNMVFIGSEKSSNSSEFKIYDVSNSTNPIVLGSLEIDNDVHDVDVAGNYAFITCNDNNAEFKIIDISNPTNPTIEAEYDLGGDGNKIFAVKDDAVYVTSNSNSSSVSIFPFPGDAYATEGIYQSPPFDTASDTTSWHSFHWEGALGISTTVGFQIRTADSESNLNTAQWAGPDGTIESYYTDTDSIIQLSPSATGTRWMQYQIVLTGDSTETPEVSLVRFQYSP